MPIIAIDIDGVRLATIDLTPMHVASVSVHGALDTMPKAGLDAMGGNYTEGGCGHLTWLMAHPLQPGEVLRVSLHALDAIGDVGKTFAELFPDEEPSSRTDFSITDDMAADIRARPQLHAAFTVQASTSGGQHATANSDEHNTDFRFDLLWDHFRPDQARVRLGTWCLDNVLARTLGTTQLQATIAAGESASFTMVA